jgi:hypothetical protein
MMSLKRESVHFRPQDLASRFGHQADAISPKKRLCCSMFKGVWNAVHSAKGARPSPLGDRCAAHSPRVVFALTEPADACAGKSEPLDSSRQMSAR